LQPNSLQVPKSLFNQTELSAGSNRFFLAADSDIKNTAAAVGPGPVPQQSVFGRTAQAGSLHATTVPTSAGGLEQKSHAAHALLPAPCHLPA